MGEVGMKNFAIMRHGPAEEESSSGRDEDRELTKKGRERVKAVAEALVDADEAPGVIVTSPLARALQTAEIVAKAAKVPVEINSGLKPDCPPRKVLEASKFGARGEMIVGHEPSLSALVDELLEQCKVDWPGRFSMEKAMVVGFGQKEGKLRLRYVLEPKGLIWIFDKRKS